MGRGKVVFLVAAAFVFGFVLGALVGAPRRQADTVAGKPEATPAPSAAELRAAFVRLEAQRMDDSLQSKVRVEMRGLTNEYVLILCPWDPAEYPEVVSGEGFKRVAIDAPKTIGNLAVEYQMKKESLKRLGFVAVVATANRENYWFYDVASDSWTQKESGDLPW